MLKKCLKYDLKPGKRLWQILSVALIGASIPIGAYFKYMDHVNEDAVFPFLFFIAVVSTYAMALVALMVVPAIMSLYHYYQTVNTDQAYLTFMLPIKRETLYLSKLIATVVRLLLSTASCVVSLLILSLFITTDDTMLFVTLFRAMGRAIKESGVFFFLRFLLVLLLFLAIEILSVSFIHFLIRKGASTKSRVGVGIALYLGLVFLGSTLSMPLMTLLASLIQVFELGFGDRLSLLGNQFFSTGMIALSLVVITTLAVMLVIKNIDSLEKKLNLL